MQRSLRYFKRINLLLVGLMMNNLYAQNTGAAGVSVFLYDLGDQFADCVELSFKNTFAHTIYLAPWDTASGKELTKDLFNISSPTGEVYKYSGKLVKQAEPTPGQMTGIQPNSYLNVKIAPTQFYNITGQIEKIAYSAFIPLYIEDNGRVSVQKFIQLNSNELVNDFVN
jgi:hypothetical protein